MEEDDPKIPMSTYIYGTTELVTGCSKENVNKIRFQCTASCMICTHEKIK